MGNRSFRSCEKVEERPLDDISWLDAAEHKGSGGVLIETRSRDKLWKWLFQLVWLGKLSYHGSKAGNSAFGTNYELTAGYQSTVRDRFLSSRLHVESHKSCMAVRDCKRLEIGCTFHGSHIPLRSRRRITQMASWSDEFVMFLWIVFVLQVRRLP